MFSNYRFVKKFSNPGKSKRFLFSPQLPDRPWRPHLESDSMGAGAFFPGVKRPEGDADHSSPSSAEVKSEWRYTYIPPCDLLTSEGRPYVL